MADTESWPTHLLQASAADRGLTLQTRHTRRLRWVLWTRFVKHNTAYTAVHCLEIDDCRFIVSRLIVSGWSINQSEIRGRCLIVLTDLPHVLFSDMDLISSVGIIFVIYLLILFNPSHAAHVFLHKPTNLFLIGWIGLMCRL